MRQWIDNVECRLPLSFLNNEDKLRKHLLFTYLSGQKKYLRTSCLCCQFPFHTLRALSILNANYFDNFRIDKRCCIIQCLMIDNKLPKMASAFCQYETNKYDILVIYQTIPEGGDLCYVSKRTWFCSVLLLLILSPTTAHWQSLMSVQFGRDFPKLLGLNNKVTCNCKCARLDLERK